MQRNVEGELLLFFFFFFVSQENWAAVRKLDPFDINPR